GPAGRDEAGAAEDHGQRDLRGRAPARARPLGLRARDLGAREATRGKIKKPPSAAGRGLSKIACRLLALVDAVAALAVGRLLHLVRGARLLLDEVLRRRHERGRLGLPAGLVALRRLLGRQELVRREDLLVILFAALAVVDLRNQGILALVQ